MRTMGNKDFFAGKAGPEEASPGSPFSNGYHQLMSPYNSYGIPESGPPGNLVSVFIFVFIFSPNTFGHKYVLI